MPLTSPVEAGGVDPPGLGAAKAIEARLRTGRLMGDEAWISLQEQTLERKLTTAKRGPRLGGGDGGD